MKESTIYICEYCNQKHYHKKDAEICENIHKKISKISNVSYIHAMKYPSRISVEMEDGTIVRYVKE